MLGDKTINGAVEKPKTIKNMSYFFYFIPYSEIVKLDRVTTKIRSLFGASFKNSEGHSLNDIQSERP